MGLDVKDYAYHLPEELVASYPSVPRDASRLLVYDTEKDDLVIDRFFNLSAYLPVQSFLVFNETKVLPSRVILYKKKPVNGKEGKVKALFLVNENQEDIDQIRAMVDRKVHVGDKLYFNNHDYVEIVDQDRFLFTMHMSFSKRHLITLLYEKGTMPIPHYIKNTPLAEKELRDSYQTIFAKKEGSVAAPTASLHFTKRVFEQMKKQGIKDLYITLHVGLGTFAPVSEDQIKHKKLHEEWYEVSYETLCLISALKHQGKELTAVGTTVVRTLESLPKLSEGVKKHPVFGKTDLFIYPPYTFHMVDHLITNFHLPGTSLLMLVEAFLKHKKARRGIKELYDIAIKNRLRFYSFGDAMLIL
ncbi:MAG: tRNA preQ1(34) S-adenosylmethionine ribosyltransferase-isomerase QueA [Patescibacteria group bacterium]